MAAQVEMKSGPGETAGGSSGHLRRTAEPPSGSQGHVTLGLQAGKPATCTKPLLTPKPFSLEKTTSIRPILPPKPQLPTAPAEASQTSDQKSSELSLADSPGVLGGDQTSSMKSNTPTAPKPALHRNPEINPPTVVIHDLFSTLQSNLLWNSKSDLLSKPKQDLTESSISVPLNVPQANLSTIPKPDDPTTPKPTTPKPTPPHTPKPDLSSVLTPVAVSTANPNLSKSEVFASPEPLSNQATTMDSPEKPRKLSVLERIKMLSQLRNSQESSASESSGMTRNEQQPRERGAGNRKMGVPISRAKSMGSLDLARWEASKDVTEEEQTRKEKLSVSPPLRRNHSVVFQPVTPQSAGSPHKGAAPRKSGVTGQLSQLASRFESLNTPDQCQPGKGNIPERKGKEARCVEEAAESQPSENTEDGLREMMPAGRTRQESKKQGADQEEAASSIKKRISLLFDPSFAQGGGASTTLEAEPHSSAQPIQEVDISVGVKQRIKQLTAESPSQCPTVRKIKARPLSQDLTKCFSPGVSMETSPSTVGLERVQTRGVDKKVREAHEKVEDPMVDSSIKGQDMSRASLTILDQSANGGTELEVQEPQSNKEKAPVETPENVVPIIPSLQLGHLDRGAVSEGILGAQLEEKASKQEEEMQKQLELERKREEERQKQLELERKREEERQKQLELERKREEERQKQLELEKKREEDRQKQLELEKKREEEREKQLERKREEERQKQLELERKREEERQKQLELEKKREEERQKQLQLEKKREEEREKQLEQEKKREEDRQKQLELEKKREEERQKQLQLEKKREEEREKQLEQEKKREEERQKQLELEKKQEEERQKQLELEKKQEEERQKQLELERKREEERQKQLELERKREEERQKQLELERKREEERQKQLELERKQKQLELERKQKQLELERKRDEERQKQLELERKREEERQKQVELERKREEERQKQLELERKREEERQKQLELERKREEERQKQLQLERKREEERQKQLELERKREEERQKQLELERKREEERQKQLELEKKREEERQKQLELEKKREEERQKQLKLERKREEERQKQLELDRKNEEREVEEPPQQICTAGEILPTSRASSSTLTEQSVREGDENATAEEIIFDDFSVKPMRWRYMRKSSLLYGNTIHTSQTQAASYDEGGENENHVENLKDQEQQGEIVEDNERLQKKIKTGIDQGRDGQGGVKREDTKGQEGAEILDPIKQPSNTSSHLSPGEKLETEEDRKPATQPLPKPATCIERALTGDRPREEDGMRDKLISKDDDRYGSLDTAQPPGEDSPTPTASTPTDALLEPGTPSELPSPSAISSVSCEATDPLLFPETPTSLLDSSALRSRVQLGKRRSQRAPPSRAARQKAAQDTKDPQFPDSAGTRSEMTAEEDVEDEEEEDEVKEEPCLTPLQPQRVALFPGMDPSVLKAQLKKRASESENQAEQLPSQRSAKSPFLPQATRVLPPVADKENREHSSPQWLQELKSKKRFSLHESDT